MSHRVVVRLLAAAFVAAFLLVPAASALGGNPNAGDVWVDNVGQPPGPGHEQDPHLACQNINLWGSGLADSSGTYTIDGWPPSGSEEQVYGPSTWRYDQSLGGSQVIDVISVKTLIANAKGDTPQANQGFHFKLEFSQDPQKHKTFWVNCGVPRISTTASSGTVGGSIHDLATLSGGNSPTGTISWNVYSASDATCSAPLNSKPLMVTVNGDGTYTSPDFAPSAPGSYQWVATYSGDAQNLGASTSCSDPNEVSTVGKASPTIATNASSAMVGGSIHDVATLTDGFFPSGTISWNVYSASDTSCSRPLNSSPLTATVSGDGTYTSPDFTPPAAGSYQWVASYSGDANNNPASTQCNDPNEVSTVSKATPAIATNASSAAAGQPLVDVATLSGGDAPTGTISWNVYRTSDTSCLTPVNTSPLTVTVSGDGTYTSPGFTPSGAGSYQWLATYSGDGNNAKAFTNCDDPNEVSTVGQTSPALATTASSTIAGGSIHDVATLSGGDSPTGTISWNLYSGGTSCSTPLNSTPLTVAVTGDGTYTSPDFTPSVAGSYQWVATYSGDSNNTGVASHCNDPNEVSTVSKASPAIATTASSGTVGGLIHDVATLSGGFAPTGTISWNVYSASDTSCSTPLNSTPLTATVSGDGAYTSPDFTPSAAGSYQWVASYQGDANNNSVMSHCNDPNEVSTVSPASPAIATTASSGIAGTPIHDVATLSGGFSPTGAISWNVYRASDTSCSTPVNPNPLTVSVAGDGTYTSPDFTPSVAGSYQWVATYGGDSNNTRVASQCNDPNEVSTVSNASPAIATTASSGTVGGSIHDVANLSGGFAPTGTISWNVYGGSDTSCAKPLNSTPLTVSVSGDGTYTSPGFTASAAGSYQWVATYNGDGNNKGVASQCNDKNEVSTVSQTPAPGIRVVKLQRDGSSGSFTSGTINARVGDRIEYEILVTNTGNTPLTLTLSDPRCDRGTISGPFPMGGGLSGDVLSPGAEARYTCSHVLSAKDPAVFTNTATVTGRPPTGPPVSGTSSVSAKKQAVSATKVMRCARGKVKKTKRVHGKKVVVCVPKQHVIVHRRPLPSFTG